MTTPQEQSLKRSTDTTIRIGLVVLLAVWCLRTLLPFIYPLLWGIILAVAVRPFHVRLASAFGGRNKLAATTMALVALSVVLVPAAMLSASVVQETYAVSTDLEQGTLTVPAPPEGAADWPLIGERLNEIWTLAATDLDAALEQNAPKLKELASKALTFVAGTLKDVLLFAISIAIAAVLLATAESGSKLSHAIGRRLSGVRGDEFVDLAEGTIRSVAQGVVGIAVIQAIAAWLGMVVIGVPGAAVWALAILLLAVMQLPPLVVLAPVIVYVFSANDTLPAVTFTVWSLIVGGSDTFLKPLLLGRGVGVPMLVILLGAIGGMINGGIIGLFVGAVVLALGYVLFMAWLNEDPDAGTEAAS